MKPTGCSAYNINLVYSNYPQHYVNVSFVHSSKMKA